jgi:hypothetical protein
MDHDSRATIAYLRRLSQDAVVQWAADHLTRERPWATGWLDVRIPNSGPPGMGWVWTILDTEDPDQGDPGQLWQFSWPHDLEVHSLFDPAEDWYVNELPVPVGTHLPPSVVASYDRRVHGGWSARAVCEALSAWAARHARRPDLRFEWAADAAPSRSLEVAMERAAAGGPTWDLGEGLVVADGVMDDLLALDPNEAARLTAILREAGSP